MDKNFSDSDIKRLLGNRVNIIKYSQLANVHNIDELINPYPCVILIETAENFGHWVCLFKFGDNQLEFFNSYGGVNSRDACGFPDDSLKFVDDEFANTHNENEPYLSELLLKSNYNMSYNEHPFQKWSTKNKKINTCGAWVVCRIWCKDMPLKDFYKLFKYKGDELVTYLTSQ